VVIPYRLQISYVYAPISNAIIIGVTCLLYFLTTYSIVPESITESMVLQDWSFSGLLGCMFLHGGLFHLIGNMLFLWVFGNAINSVVGNIWYTFVYLFLGLCASSTHLFFSDIPAIGASGAVNGIIGMSLVLFPVNKLECIFLFGFIGAGFKVYGYMMVGLWFVFDIVGAVSGGGEIAYWAHVGGFISGMAMATILLAYNKIASYDRTLFDIATGRGKEEEPHGYLSPESKDYGNRVVEVAQSITKNDFSSSDALTYDPFTDSYVQKEQIETSTVPSVAEPLPDMDRPPLPEPSVTSFISQKTPDIPPSADVPVPVLPEGVKPLPVLSLRLLRILRENNKCTCFIVNEGDELESVSVESPDVVGTEIYPNKIFKKKEPGWIKLTYPEGYVPKQLSFTLTCRGGISGMFQTRLTINETSKKIVEE